MKKLDSNRLLDKAREAQRKAYAPYTRYPVGAAVQASDGSIYTGTSIENTSYSMGVCAERVAIWKAVSEGARSIVAIAVSRPPDWRGGTRLCGTCQEVLREFSPEEITIIYGEESSRKYSIARGLGILSETLRLFSCFISYNHKDEDFAKKLHVRLTAEGIETWFAPESIAVGDNISEEIGRGIRKSDKIIIVLSEHSMASSWVTHELRRARKKEKELGRRMIVPIALTSFDKIRNWESMYSDLGEDLAEEVRGLKMADFSEWRNAEAFEEAFRSLLRGLTKKRDK